MVIPRAVKQLWLPNAAAGQRFRNLGSLSSTATVGFASGNAQDGLIFLHVNLLRLHDVKGGKAIYAAQDRLPLERTEAHQLPTDKTLHYQ